jgi:hypothetical protein
LALAGLLAGLLGSVGCQRDSQGGGSVDMTPPAPARNAAEVVAGAGRVAGGGLTLDVQVGHAVGQAPVRGSGGVTLEGASAIKR